MRALFIASLLSLAGCNTETPTAAPPLPALAAATPVAVAGVSSGASMAAQYQVAFAATVSGAGLVAGAPWGCARGEIARALGPCLSGEGIDVARLVATARESAAAGRIAALDELVDDRVYLFHGKMDTVVRPAVTAAAADWYRLAAPGADLLIRDDVPAAHGWPTESNGAACDEMAAPFINACGVDVAGQLLVQLFGELLPPVPVQGGVAAFDQGEFAATGLADTGYVFVPPRCRDDGGCRVLVFFHGCNQSAMQIGTTLIDAAGLLGRAAANDLIVLFPQVAPSSQAPLNPLACWDWWGYSGTDYLGREAPQLAAMRAMVARLQQAR